MRRQTRPHQLVLGSARPTLPTWRSLPGECRDEVMQLLARMIKEQVRCERAAASAPEVDDE
ncbi:MAG: hypothetical protein IT371_06680 [Deltaproteobacteria bacterium]|nr:hypothetical protein [Deltaproteobacteria bacterium]